MTARTITHESIYSSLFVGKKLTVNFVRDEINDYSCELSAELEENLRLFVSVNACKILDDMGYTDETIRKKLSDSSISISTISSHCHVIIPIKFKKTIISFDDIDEVPITDDYDDSMREMKKRNIQLQYSFIPIEQDSVCEIYQKTNLFMF